MTKYNKGKIYKIEPIQEHEEHELYIGSTTKDKLCQRMAAHRSDYKQYKQGKRSKITAFDLFDKYGIDNCNILLIEECKCENKDELIAREGYYVRTSKCINKYIPDRKKKEYNQLEHRKQYVKAYDEKNKEKKKEYLKEYNKKNKDKISLYHKTYQQENREAILQKDKVYYEENKEEINTKRKEIMTCECGRSFRKADRSKHYKTKIHLELMNTISQ
jgi:hypothetical protein